MAPRRALVTSVDAEAQDYSSAESQDYRWVRGLGGRPRKVFRRPHSNRVTSVLREEDLGRIRAQFRIPDSIALSSARRNPPGAIHGRNVVIFVQAFHYGLRLPLSRFAAGLLREYKISLGQLTPEAWCWVASFEITSHAVGVTAYPRVFLRFFKIIPDPRADGLWYTFQRRKGIMGVFTTPPEVRGWRREFILGDVDDAISHRVFPEFSPAVNKKSPQEMSKDEYDASWEMQRNGSSLPRHWDDLKRHPSAHALGFIFPDADAPAITLTETVRAATASSGLAQQIQAAEAAAFEARGDRDRGKRPVIETVNASSDDDDVPLSRIIPGGPSTPVSVPTPGYTPPPPSPDNSVREEVIKDFIKSSRFFQIVAEEKGKAVAEFKRSSAYADALEASRRRGEDDLRRQLVTAEDKDQVRQEAIKDYLRGPAFTERLRSERMKGYLEGRALISSAEQASMTAESRRQGAAEHDQSDELADEFCHLLTVSYREAFQATAAYLYQYEVDVEDLDLDEVILAEEEGRTNPSSIKIPQTSPPVAETRSLVRQLRAEYAAAKGKKAL